MRLVMAGSELKLLGRWSSPFAMRATIALRIKSLEYEHLEEHFNPKSDLLLQSNPVYTFVPVLIHHGKPICESLNIVQYIDETWPSAPSIFPSHSYDRSIARFWAYYLDDKWFPTMKKILIVEDDEEEARKAYYKTMDEVVWRMEEAFGEISKGKPFFGGDQIGFIDIALGSTLGWLSVVETVCGRKFIAEEKAPCLVGWAERFVADPNVDGLIPETDKLIELAMVLKIKWRAALSNK